MTGGDSMTDDMNTYPRLPDPREFNPERDPFPEMGEAPEKDRIPGLLEWKLDIVLTLLARILGQLRRIRNLLWPGLIPVVWLLFLIWLQLVQVNATLKSMASVLSGVFLLLAFFVIRWVVPRVIAKRKR
jgi:hypothetical protein